MDSTYLSVYSVRITPVNNLIETRLDALERQSLKADGKTNAMRFSLKQLLIGTTVWACFIAWTAEAGAFGLGLCVFGTIFVLAQVGAMTVAFALADLADQQTTMCRQKRKRFRRYLFHMKRAITPTD